MLRIWRQDIARKKQLVSKKIAILTPFRVFRCCCIEQGVDRTYNDFYCFDTENNSWNLVKASDTQVMNGVFSIASFHLWRRQQCFQVELFNMRPFPVFLLSFGEMIYGSVVEVYTFVLAMSS